MPLYIAKSGDLEGCHACLTDRLTTLKDRATQLLRKYKSGALVTQLNNETHPVCDAMVNEFPSTSCQWNIFSLGTCPQMKYYQRKQTKSGWLILTCTLCSYFGPHRRGHCPLGSS